MPLMIRPWQPHELQEKITQTPKHVFLFGAGASFGSDGMHLFKANHLPPLGRNLFPKLCADRNLRGWSDLPEEIRSVFQDKRFEEAMDYLDSTEGWANGSSLRDRDLSRYFSQFTPQSSNLYWRLAHLLSSRLKDRSWSGAIVTLNYDRLLEESLMGSGIFPVVRGITDYDKHLQLDETEFLEVCYPHGACQFFIGQNYFSGEGEVIFGPEARLLQTAGATHILKKNNIPIACDKRQFPMICRYQSNKRPFVSNYFIDTQQERTRELIDAAESVTIVGVYCAYKTDRHVWEALSCTRAKIHYLEPSTDSQGLFTEWAATTNKKEGESFVIQNRGFKDGFEYIREINGL